ncbi:MAG: dockerin type I domain-containing protein [Dehalococcoidia bacterium]|nr:dockerin type I domain-containing protein [Dehalococcoidia bacterium]
MTIGFLTAGTASAQTEAVSIENATLSVGAQGGVDLEALDIPAPGLGAWIIDVAYNPAIVTVKDCTPHPAGVCNEAYDADTVRTAGASAGGLEGDTTLANIEFTCDAEGVSPLTITIQELADATEGDPQPIDATIDNGSITCNEGGPNLLGDANCDGEVNSIDAALVLQLEVGLIDEVPCPKNADVNEDGQINAVDAAIILQIEAGIIPQP